MIKVVVAEDDPTTQTLIIRSLSKMGYQATACSDGDKALQILQNSDTPTIALLDWMMPVLDGIQVCQTLRKSSSSKPLYLVLLTSKGEQDDIVKGFKAGADDYIVKPFDLEEFCARVRVGVRILDLQASLAARVQELESALQQVKQLRGMVPICSYCKKIRDDRHYWQQVEEYLSANIDIQFSHGVCPSCYEKELVPQLRAAKRKF